MNISIDSSPWYLLLCWNNTPTPLLSISLPYSLNSTIDSIVFQLFIKDFILILISCNNFYTSIYGIWFDFILF